MKLIRLATLAGIVGITMVSLSAADIDGKWKGQLPGRDGNMRDIAFDFKSDGTTLGGTMQGFRGEVPITEGKMDNGVIRFKVTVNLAGNSMAMNYEGAQTGSELRMKMANADSPRSVEFLLKKQ